jgi:hypothetical protein
MGTDPTPEMPERVRCFLTESLPPMDDESNGDGVIWAPGPARLLQSSPPRRSRVQRGQQRRTRAALCTGTSISPWPCPGSGIELASLIAYRLSLIASSGPDRTGSTSTKQAIP